MKKSKNKIGLLLLKAIMPLGGAETLILQHLKNINREIFRVHIVTLKNEGVLLAEAIKQADQYTCLYKKLPIDPLSLFKLRRYIIINNIEVVHCHDWISALYIYLSASGLKIKKIVTIHSQNKSIVFNLGFFILNSFDKIITVSRYQRLNLFEKGVPWNKIDVVYNCFDDKKFEVIERNDLNKTKNPFKIVMTGNFYWQKDQLTLIEAIKKLVVQGFNIELHLVGARGVKNLQECRDKVKKENLVNIVSFDENTRVDSKFLSDFDLFVFSSKSETFGIVLLEAMASGLPVLVSDIPSNMELIRYGQDGFYFETANSIDCAEKIKELIKNTIELQNKRNSGLNRVKEFTPQVIVRNLEVCYRNILNLKNL